MSVDEDDVEDYLSGNIPIDASEFHYDSGDIELESELNTDKEPKKSCDVIVEELRLKEKYLNLFALQLLEKGQVQILHNVYLSLVKSY